METVTYKITGTSMLMTHNERLANPYDPITRNIKAITGKRKKTDEDRDAIARLEWEGGMYLDAKAGPFVPGYNLLRCMVEAARLTKQGKDLERGGVLVLEDVVPIEYDGPRTADAMYKDGRFLDVRGVKLQGKKTMRARPKWEQWALKFTACIDPEMIDPAQVTAILETAGQRIGLGDYRPRFGRFAVQVQS